jgi:predicted DNA-binding protein
VSTTSIRLNKDQEKEIEEYASRENVDKSTAIRKLVEIGLKEVKLQEALENVRKKKWTIWKSASYCDESFRSFLSIMKTNNIPFPISLDELRIELHE